MKSIHVLIAASSALAFAGAAQAQSINTDSPGVLKGRLDVVVENEIVDVDGEDNLYGHTGYVYYSPTDRLQFAAGVVALDPPNEGLRTLGYLLEVQYEGARPAWLPFDWALQGTYAVGAVDGVNDALQVKGIAERDFGAVLLTLNLDATVEVGGGRSDETTFGYNVRGLYQVTEAFDLGLELVGGLGTSDEFGDLSDNAQYLGPVAFVEFPLPFGRAALGVEGGVLFGLNDVSADTVGKINLTLAQQF